MEAKEYKEQALRTESNNFDTIGERVNKRTLRLLHAALGMQTESAEFSDALKKHLMYGKELNVVNLKEELFDQMWYVAIALDELGYEFEEGFQININKLKARYPNKFNETDAVHRNLEKELEILSK